MKRAEYPEPLRELVAQLKRMPGIGPLVSPSFYGAKYASGTFELLPTVMHVSQGISGKTPLRYCCPPELAKLVLIR